MPASSSSPSSACWAACQASYLPASLTASTASGRSLSDLRANRPSPWPSLPARRRSLSLVSRSTLPRRALTRLAWASAEGTTRLLRAGTAERWARMRSERRGFLKLWPLRRRAWAGAWSARSWWRTDELPAVSISNRGLSSWAEWSLRAVVGAAFLLFARCLGMVAGGLSGSVELGRGRGVLGLEHEGEGREREEREPAPEQARGGGERRRRRRRPPHTAHSHSRTQCSSSQLQWLPLPASPRAPSTSSQRAPSPRRRRAPARPPPRSSSGTAPQRVPQATRTTTSTPWTRHSTKTGPPCAATPAPSSSRLESPTAPRPSSSSPPPQPSVRPSLADHSLPLERTH